MLRTLDPKVVVGAVSALLSLAVVRLGLDVDDPTVAAVLPILVGAITGYLTPNAAAGLENRWQPAADTADQLEADVGLDADVDLLDKLDTADQLDEVALARWVEDEQVAR